MPTRCPYCAFRFAFDPETEPAEHPDPDDESAVAYHPACPACGRRAEYAPTPAA